MRDYKKLEIWRRSYRFTLEVYKVVDAFPQKEKYRISDQLCRASSSIPSNIAEGCGRNSRQELIRFLYISLGSSFEVENHILLAKDLKYIDNDLGDTLINEINELKKMIYSYISKLTA
jgi:four helix bundle protein